MRGMKAPMTWRLQHVLPVLLILLAVLPNGVRGLDGIDNSAVGSFTVTKDNRREIIISSFGLGPNGNFSISIKNFKIDPVPGNDTKAVVGLYIRRTQTVTSASLSQECVDVAASLPTIQKNQTTTFIPFNKNFESWELSHLVAEEEAGLWTTSLVNCDESYYITCDIHHEQFNEGPMYLSYGEAHLPLILGVLAIAYIIASIVWLTQLVCRKDRKVVWPHWLMLLLVCIKSITLILVSLKYYTMKMGYSSEGWAISFYVFTFMRGSVTFVILLLIGTGWVFVKPFLSDRDKKIFAVVIPLQILANVAQVVISETEQGLGSWSFWNGILITVDLLCYALVFVPIMQTRRYLAMTNPEGKVQKLQQKYKLWGTFYFLIFGYMYFTRVVVQILVAILPYHVAWLSDFFNEVSTLLFYIFIAYKLRPEPNNPYLQVDTDDEEEVEIPLESISGVAHKRKPTTSNPEP